MFIDNFVQLYNLFLGKFAISSSSHSGSPIVPYSWKNLFTCSLIVTYVLQLVSAQWVFPYHLGKNNLCLIFLLCFILLYDIFRLPEIIMYLFVYSLSLPLECRHPEGWDVVMLIIVSSVPITMLSKWWALHKKEE